MTTPLDIPDLEGPLADKVRSLTDQLTPLGRLAIGLSGGVDSTLLTALAARALGPANVLAVTDISPLHPSGDRRRSARLARELGVEHAEIETVDLSDPAFATNPPDRCYRCKQAVFGAIRRVARERGIEHVASGDNADDAGSHRPGMKALEELEVLRPLLDAGLTKDEIRTVSRTMGLETADSPSMACLASRFPYGRAITADGLERVDRAERVLAELGFDQYRVRDHDPIARIEVPADQLAEALDHRERIVPALVELGFTYVTLDLAGFRSGSLDEGPAPR